MQAGQYACDKRICGYIRGSLRSLTQSRNYAKYNFRRIYSLELYILINTNTDHYTCNSLEFASTGEIYYFTS